MTIQNQEEIIDAVSSVLKSTLPWFGVFEISMVFSGILNDVVPVIRNAALDEAAEIARANTTAPRIYIDKVTGWISPAGEEIAAEIEGLKT